MSKLSTGHYHHHLCHHPHQQKQQKSNHQLPSDLILCKNESCCVDTQRKSLGSSNTNTNHHHQQSGSIGLTVDCNQNQHQSIHSQHLSSSQRIIINPLSLLPSNSFQPMISPPNSRSVESSGDIRPDLVNSFPSARSSTNHGNNNSNGNSSGSMSNNGTNSNTNEDNPCQTSRNPFPNVYPSSLNSTCVSSSSQSSSLNTNTTTNNINTSHNSSFKCVSQPSYSPPPSPTSQHTNSIGTSPIPLASGPEVTADPNWQANRTNVRERNAAMFNNDLMSDITFVVGPRGSQQKIPAHKYVLATGSAVFFAMFYGGLAESSSEIEIPDVEPAAFFALLR